MKNQHTMKKASGHNGPDESTGPVSEVNRQLQQSAGRTLRTSKKGLAVLSARSLILSFTLMCGLASTTAFAGPIILGGDDLDLHGSYSSGANKLGWLYIQKALASMYNAGCITRPGHDGSIAALGAPCSTSGNDAGAAIHFPGNVALGKVVNCYEGDTGPTGINNFFTLLSAGTAKPAIIYIPSSDYDAPNGISVAEGNALTAHAADLKNFVNSGGGLMAHIDGPRTSGWVTTVTGVTVNLTPPCNSTGATLTPAGSMDFPGLSNSDIAAGPCHATFSGTLGGLSVLAWDGSNPKRNLIIGGGCGTTIGATPTPASTPTPTPPGSCEFSATTVCQGTATVFTDLSTGATSWNWNFGETTSATNTSTQQNPTHTYTNPGTYTVKLSVNGGACTVTHTVTVTAGPLLPIITGPDSTCGKTATYCITKAANSSYTWNVTNGTMTGPTTTGNQICITVTWNSTGNGLITVKVNDGQTCCSLPAQLLVRACDDYCCEEIKGAAATDKDPQPLGGGLYSFTPSLSAAVKVVRVTATVISTSQTFTTAACGTSGGPVNSYVKPPLSSVTGFASSLPVTDPREVDWNSSVAAGVNINAGVAFPFNIQFQPQSFTATETCPDIIRFCVKYTFTDAGCRTCEIIRCYLVQRPGGGPPK